MSHSLGEKLPDSRPDDSEHAQFLNVSKEDPDVGSPLPSPITTPAAKPKTKVSTTVIIPIWIALSSAVIIYNNYLYNTLNFKFPVFLVTWHLSFAVRLLCAPA